MEIFRLSYFSPWAQPNYVVLSWNFFLRKSIWKEIMYLYIPNYMKHGHEKHHFSLIKQVSHACENREIWESKTSSWAKWSWPACKTLMSALGNACLLHSDFSACYFFWKKSNSSFWPSRQTWWICPIALASVFPATYSVGVWVHKLTRRRDWLVAQVMKVPNDSLTRSMKFSTKVFLMWPLWRTNALLARGMSLTSSELS